MKDLLKLDITKFSTMNIGDTYTSPTVTIKPREYTDDAYQMYFTVKLESQNITNRTSNVTIKTYLRTLSNVYGWYDISNYIETYVKINQEPNYTLINRTNVRNLPTYNPNNWVECSSCNTTVASSIINETSLYVKINLIGNEEFGFTPRNTSMESGALSLQRVHTPPQDVTFTLTEMNQNLINAEVDDDIFVKNLSIKEFVFDATFSDGATLESSRVINYASPLDWVNNEEGYLDTCIYDFTQKTMTPYNIPEPPQLDKIAIIGTVFDDFGSSGNAYGYSTSNPQLFDYIPYEKVNINDNSIVFKRVGQISGQASITLNGNFYIGEIGNVDQSNGYKPTIKYKFWKQGTTEPLSYDYTINANNITIDTTNSTFSISQLNIGSTTETDVNYFDPNYSWIIKFIVNDNFTSYTTSKEIKILKAQYLWGEYTDRVDFAKITIKNKAITPLKRTLLWQNEYPTSAFLSQNINLSSSDYDELIWYFKETGTSGNIFSSTILKGYGTRLSFSFAPSDVKGAIYSRTITRNSDTSFSADSAYYYYHSGSQNGVNNNLCVPICVYGIKYMD